MNRLPLFLGGLGERNYGGKYRLGNRVYSIYGNATTLLASSRGSTGGYSALYVVRKNEKR